jgi:hypothetical protein
LRCVIKILPKIHEGHEVDEIEKRESPEERDAKPASSGKL